METRHFGGAASSSMKLIMVWLLLFLTLSRTVSTTVNTTTQHLPSPPQNVTLEFRPEVSFSFDPVSRQLNTTVAISWQPPAEPNGTVIAYTLMLMSEEMWGLIVLNESVSGSETSAVFEVTVFPYELYTVSIFASTEAGDSNEADSDTVFSPQAKPEAVSDVELIFSESSAVFNSTSRLLDVSMTLTWSPPAELNGELLRFSVTMENTVGEVVFENLTVSSSSTSLTATVQVFPSEGYFATVNTTTGGGTSSNSSSTVTSPEAAPSPPLNVTVTSITSNSALLRWSAPEFPNGEIQSYNITVTTGTTPTTQLLTSSSTERLLESLFPFTTYSVTLYAINSEAGEMSEELQFTTSES
jgi:hypothetical protein